MTRSRPRESVVTIFALLLVLVACTGEDDSIRGKWELDSFVVDGTVVEVTEDTNTTGRPFFEFDEYVWGHAGCNNFGDNGDYEYVFEGGQLSFLEEIPKDAGQCVPDDLMAVERLFEEILWSNREITVDIDGDSMTWQVEKRILDFTRTD